MLARLRHALLLLAATAGLVVMAPATPAHAVCNSAPNYCARIVHSVYSDVYNLSVTRVRPATSGYLEALARGTAGTYAGYYLPVCYQAIENSSIGSFVRIGAGWRYVGVLGGSYVIELERIC